ncbi:MAG: hypothetical protein R3303_05650 [Marinobacter sp.]|nr:hypothetical protein [Marinobacter sp.]
MWSPKNVAIAAAVVVIGGWYLKRQATEVIKDTAQAVNPVNHDNVFNSGFNALYGAVTDGKGTLGTDTADAVQSVKDWWAN